ncbi:uncharacterized protein EDB91DRAFT_1124488 [Suillus paluster]|uniref:uncharacterized protein n=1 Tax=Suillus paluster TaxID=48578 RepID=UPI001B886A6B|nr:uncharacterized protein EDB91DRAFT_1124488 [Suillus paluster]KAG1744099.1 hypothetical protein EDB91DRAFT_1124488 [Suillus paluster]
MLPSRFIMFALLSFLAGVNACVQCPATVMFEGSATKLAQTIPGDVISCIYRKSTSPALVCRYDVIFGYNIEGHDYCPTFAIVKRWGRRDTQQEEPCSSADNGVFGST